MTFLVQHVVFLGFLSWCTMYFRMHYPSFSTLKKVRHYKH